MDFQVTYNLTKCLHRICHFQCHMVAPEFATLTTSVAGDHWWQQFRQNYDISVSVALVPSEVAILTHWDRVTHICVSKIIIIGPDNGLSPGQCQAIIWTNAGILLIRTFHFSGILSEIHTVSFQKMHLKCRLEMTAISFRLQCVNDISVSLKIITESKSKALLIRILRWLRRIIEIIILWEKWYLKMNNKNIINLLLTGYNFNTCMDK